MIDWLITQPAWLQALFGTIFTWFMTALGAAFVFISSKLNARAMNIMQGSAAGIMIAASFFSLLLPAMERLESEGIGLKVGGVLTIGFLLGGAFILLTDVWMSKIGLFSDQSKRSGVLSCFAITLHNIPEGFAVGVAFGSMTGEYSSCIAAIMLAVGIGIQNFPEGLCVSVPLRKQGFSVGKAFFFGQFSGFVEVIAGVLGAIAVGLISTLLPWALAFSAGAMIAVSCAELIPACVADGKRLAVCGVSGGFALMMLLDVLLG